MLVCVTEYSSFTKIISISNLKIKNYIKEKIAYKTIFITDFQQLNNNESKLNKLNTII
jgi:hypothetical protein